jgi:hypothetical protein
MVFDIVLFTDRKRRRPLPPGIHKSAIRPALVGQASNEDIVSGSQFFFGLIKYHCKFTINYINPAGFRACSFFNQLMHIF